MKEKFKDVLKISSYMKSISWGIYKIIISIPLQSVMMFLSAFYSIGIGISKRNTLKNKKDDYNKYILTGIIIGISSVVYILYSVYGFINGMRTNYDLNISLVIATVSFTDLIIAIIGVIKSRKINELKHKVIKLSNLASAFTLIVLTQTALLSMCMEEDNSKANGFMGILMGIASMIVGMYIIFLVSNEKKVRVN